MVTNDSDNINSKAEKLFNLLEEKEEEKDIIMIDQQKKNINDEENLFLEIDDEGIYLLHINKSVINKETGKSLLIKHGFIKTEENQNQAFQVLQPIPTKLGKQKFFITNNNQETLNRKNNTSPNVGAERIKKQKVLDDQVIEKMKISLKNYLSLPTCDICGRHGITIKELSNDNISDSDVNELNYLLLRCFDCKSYVHSGCIKSEKKLNLEFKDVEWRCDFCDELRKLNFNSNNLITNSNFKNISCKICFKSQEDTSKPHLFKQLTDEIYVHYLCLLWIPESKQIVNFQDNKDFLKRLTEIKRYSGKCQLCNSLEVSPTIKCTSYGCEARFHPICINDNYSYFEFIQVGNMKVAFNCFCQDHSKKLILKELNFNL